MNSKLPTSVAAAGLACLFGFNAGCSNLPQNSYFHDVHLSKSHMNRDIFKDMADFEGKLKRVEERKDMSEDDVFKALEIDKGRFAIVSPKEVMPWLTAGVNLNPQTREAIDYTIELAGRAKVYTIQFKEVDTHGGLKLFAATQTEQEGFDMQMVLAFMDGKLFRARAAGNPHVNGKEIHFVWETIGDGLKGAVLGGGVVGAAKFLK